MSNLTFRELEEACMRRTESSYPGCAGWIGVDWSNALAGEAGEACNVVKKLRRGDDVPLSALADELGDVVVYAGLVARFYGLSLEDCVRDKFNAVSQRVGSVERL